jgi:CMP-2-keto-3-deoxyoctulosonic acid synthetase
VAEAARGLSEEIILNLQGDEPMMDPSVIDAVAGPLLADPTVMMATAAIVQENPEEFVRPSIVKVVVDDRGDALYFSRAPIPHFRDTGCGKYRKPDTVGTSCCGFPLCPRARWRRRSAWSSSVSCRAAGRSALLT